MYCYKFISLILSFYYIHLNLLTSDILCVIFKIHNISCIQTREEKKVYKNNEAGITLIALVVTVIIIMILAGVSISMLTGQNRNNNTSNRSII